MPLRVFFPLQPFPPGVTIIKKKYFFTVYLFLLRERQKTLSYALTSRGGAEREGETESQAGSELPAQSPHVGLDPMNLEIMT